MLPRDTCDVITTDELIELTRSPDVRIRLRALRNLCPCRVKANEPAFWARILEMAGAEPDARVRYQVLHNLCDGSPNAMEAEIVAAVDDFTRDADKKCAKTARRVMTVYRRTGKWNVL